MPTNRTRKIPGGARIGLAAAAAVVIVAAAGCGSGGSGASGPRVDSSTEAAPRDAATATAPGNQLVRYGGVQFEVPADWPVHDLAADPATCVRFDEHAVYLGPPSDSMRCPAGVFGHAEAVLVEPLASSPLAAEATVATDVNGLAAMSDPTAAIEQQVRAVFPDVGVAVTISFADRSQADSILASFRATQP